MKVLVMPDPAAAAARAAEAVADAIRAKVGRVEDGVFHLAVSGGSTPAPMFVALAAMDLPWDRVHIWQVDERIAPVGHPDRNLVRQAVLRGTLHPMPVDEPDAFAAARTYAPPRLDLVHLGLGADGHTASLVPGDPVVDEEEAEVGVTLPYQGRRRMTLTFLPINRARARLWLVCGAEKREMIAALLRGDRDVVAGRVTPADTCLVCDAAAMP